MNKSTWGANANLILSAAVFVLGWVRLIGDDGGGRWIGVLMVLLGLVGVAGGLVDRATARKAAQVRAGLTPGDRAVVLRDVGERKVEVIRQLRETLGLDLRDAKRLVDAPGATAVSSVAPEIAESVAERLRTAGATVDVVEASSTATSEGSERLP